MAKWAIDRYQPGGAYVGALAIGRGAKEFLMIREARASYVRQGSLGRHRANNGIICPRQSQPVFNGSAKRMPGTASVAQADQTPARVPKVDIPVPGLEEPPGPAQFPV